MIQLQDFNHSHLFYGILKLNDRYVIYHVASTNRILDVLDEDNLNIWIRKDFAQILAAIVGNM
jgi:hypothetical protein